MSLYSIYLKLQHFGIWMFEISNLKEINMSVKNESYQFLGKSVHNLCLCIKASQNDIIYKHRYNYPLQIYYVLKTDP